jgi:hypothetical protein
VRCPKQPRPCARVCSVHAPSGAHHRRPL